MTTDIDQRESKVLDFINANNDIKSTKAQYDNINNSPEIKLRKLNDEYNKGKSICIDTIIGRLYKDALPFDDPKKNCSDDTARSEIRDFICRMSNGKCSEYYIREAIKKNNSSILKSILLEAENIAKKFYNERAKNIGTINTSDLNFNMNMDDDSLSKITKKLELDEIAEIIHDNVQKTIQDESNKAKREDEYKNQIEDSLANDDSVVDDASMEAAIEKMNVISNPVVYQPSLFESIMLGKAKILTESTTQDIMTETIHEYTKLNIIKALKLESFTLDTIKKLADKYLMG